MSPLIGGSTVYWLVNEDKSFVVTLSQSGVLGLVSPDNAACYSGSSEFSLSVIYVNSNHTSCHGSYVELQCASV